MSGEREDLEALLNAAIDVATDVLASSTEFLPFALAMQEEDGEIFHLESDETDAGADHELILAALTGGLREAAAEGRWRAVARVADVTVEDEDGEPMSSAIHIMLEHRNAEAITCSVPYAIEDTVELDELVAEPGDDEVFAPLTPPN